MRLGLFVVLLFAALTSGAATNRVGGGFPFSTVQAAVNASVAGDRIEIYPGTYVETVTITLDGNSSNWINIVGMTNGGPVILRKLAFNGANYIRVINIEITHPLAGFSQAVTFAGVCSNLEFIKCYIHDTQHEAFQMLAGSSPSFITVRDCRIDYLGYPSAEAMNVLSPVAITPHHILFEYNRATRFADFVDFNGSNNIARNNSAWWVDSGLWTIIPHPDIFQPGSDGINTGSRHHIYERNWVGQSTNEHSHFGLWKDNMNAGDSNMVIRGNIAHHFGGGGVGNEGFDAVRVYQNTLFKMCMNDNGAALIVARFTATGGILKNNILADDGLASSGNAINIEATNPYDATHNWGYDAGFESWLGTTYPQFVSTNIATLDLRLQSSSPCRGVGTNVVWATTNTTSDTFHVNDSQRLTHGFGIVEGDLVVIGGQTVRVLNSDWTNNTIRVSTTVTVTNTQPVYWGRLGDQKDMGGYPYGAELLTAAQYTVAGGTATVTTTGDARLVYQYRGQVPIAVDYDAPFTFSHQEGDTYDAMAEWAQKTPVVQATEAGAAPPAALVTIPGAGKANRTTGPAGL